MTLLRILAVATFLALPQFAAAQTAPLTPGERLRVTVSAPAASVRLGAFRALTDSTLVLFSRDAELAIPRANVLRVERSRGHRLSTAGAVGGFVLGAAAGGALGCAANRDSYGVYCGGQNDTKVFGAAAVGGIAGGFLGAYLFRRERWTEVPLR